MPRYEYRCSKGHRSERFRPFAESSLPSACPTCGEEAGRIISAPHVPPDGVYSYAPNLGDPVAFERRREGMKAGQRVFKKSDLSAR